PSHSPLDFLAKRIPLHNPFSRGASLRRLASNLVSTPIFYNFVAERRAKRSLLRSALLGLGAGLGSLALPQQKRSIWRGRSGSKGSNLGAIGRLLAGGLVAAAVARLFSKPARSRNTHNLHAHDRHTHDQLTQDQFD